MHHLITALQMGKWKGPTVNVLLVNGSVVPKSGRLGTACKRLTLCQFEKKRHTNKRGLSKPSGAFNESFLKTKVHSEQ